MPGTDLVPAAQYAALATNTDDLVQAIQDNLAGEQLNQFDLDRIGMPTVGNTIWTVPSLEGEQHLKTIDGVIVFFKNTRGYWTTSFEDSGGGTPPDCRSDDGIIGIGDPGDKLREQGKGCAQCPHSQFGSGRGNSQACNARRLLFVLRPEGLLPLAVDLSPASLKDARKYMTRLVGSGVPYWSVVTRIGLEKRTGEGVPDYAVATFEMAQRLEGDVLARVKSYADELKPMFMATPAIADADITPAPAE